MAADPLTAAAVEELFNFDSTDDEDPLKDKPQRKTNRDDKTTLSPRGPGKRKASTLDDTLGLDSEIKIKKQRKPIAKLDEARLLSAPGLPKLRADARMSNFLTNKIRLKGKGHEFSDVARLLNYYQLWLDDLYPRAKFADGLQLVEKAGHSRRMQVMRKEWIDEGKPGYIGEQEARKRAEKEERELGQQSDAEYAGGEALMSGGNNEPLDTRAAAEVDSLFVPDAGRNQIAKDDEGGLPEDDELDALLAEQGTHNTSRPAFAPKRVVEDDSEGEDDLDALLAEQDHRIPATATTASGPVPDTHRGSIDQDDDEDMDHLDAMLAEQDARSRSRTTQDGPSNESPSFENTERGDTNEEFAIDDDDDLEALLAEQETHGNSGQLEMVSSLPVTKPQSQSRTPEDQVEDVEEEAADMFSSSPLLDTAVVTLSHGVQQEVDLQFPISHGSVPIEEVVSVQQQDAIDGSVVGQGGEPVEEEEPLPSRTNEEDDSQRLDAGDMFSSSPVQND